MTTAFCPAAAAAAETSSEAHEAPKNAILQQACEQGLELLARLGLQEDEKEDQEEEEEACSGANLPQFLPVARALVFLRTLKVGTTFMGGRHGHGFVIARLPEGGLLGKTWSPPCFVKCTGVEFGLVCGVEQVDTLIGVMSERALQQAMHKRQVALGSEWSVALWPFKKSSTRDTWESVFTSDLAMMHVGRGLMVDASLTGDVVSIDHARNAACYGPLVSPEAILTGALPPRPEMQPLARRLREASCRVIATSLEPSWYNGGSSPR